MLSYRHAFHAGNHADVLKHWVLLECLQYLNQKDKAWWYVDTHAGAGCYALEEGRAGQTGEYLEGVARLWERKDLPATLNAYLDRVRQFNPGGKLVLYPGSPALAMTCLRPQDRMRLFELHPADIELLQRTFDGERERVVVRHEDGFAGLRALLPPPPRRALVLIDPPYEVKTDYRQVVDSLQDALKRFSTGVYAVWYPLLKRLEVVRLRESLRKLPAQNWLDVTLSVRRPPLDGFGLYGSGMFVVNPPWPLPKALEQGLPVLEKALGLDDGAAVTLDFQVH